MSLLVDTLADTIRDSIGDADATRDDWERAVRQAFGPDDDTAPVLTGDEARAVAAARDAMHDPELDALAADAEASGHFAAYDEARADHNETLGGHVGPLLGILDRLAPVPARPVKVMRGL